MSKNSKLTNTTGIGLSMAVYLANDLYDHNDDPNTISVTTLIKSTRQIILGARASTINLPSDISDRIKAQSGTALHTAVEVAWLTNYVNCMKRLGYPESIIKRIRINPTESELSDAFDEGIRVLPIYLEKRASKVVNGWNITGKFDIVIEGKLEDIKRTGTYTFVNKTNDKKYIMQGSLYKWLNQNIITSDFLTIQFEFSDWKLHEFKQNPKNYPKQMMMSYRLPLATIEQTEEFVNSKTLELNKLWDADETDLPLCTKEDLWMSDPIFKYWKNPESQLTGKRSTKNFTVKGEAYARLAKDGNVGIVVKSKTTAKACAYCNAYEICTQKDNYIT